ncbi:MAG: agmatinase [Phyllobacterium sp.]
MISSSDRHFDFPLTSIPNNRPQTFLNAPLCMDIDTLEADIAIIGLPYGNSYDAARLNGDQTKAPDAIRVFSNQYFSDLSRHDFDLGGPLLDNRDIRLVDVGNVHADVKDMASHFPRAETAVRKILKAGALPIVLGGDHAIPIPVLRAFEGRGPITLVQIDAHIDWRDEFNGIRDGLSSPIRRASELDHIGEIFQIGIRGPGSARPAEVQDALAYGAKLITASEVFDNGIDAILARIPAGGNYYITIDADGLDPSVMPAVGGPAPGGLLFHHVRRLIETLTRKGKVVGMDIVEIKPSIDVNGISSLNAVRFIMNLIGTAVRAGYFEERK